jgi:hypothetical protein
LAWKELGNGKAGDEQGKQRQQVKYLRRKLGWDEGLLQ